MIFLHGTFIDSILGIWAETDEYENGSLPSEKKTSSKIRSAKTEIPAPHPWSASSELLFRELAPVFESANLNYARAEAEEKRPIKRKGKIRQEEAAPAISENMFIAELPSIKGLPVPSSPMIAEIPVSKKEPEFKTWLLQGISLAALPAVKFLSSIESALSLAGAKHIKIMPDLHFCIHLVRFAGALVSRQNFLPGISGDKEPIGIWEPVFTGLEQERRDSFIRSVPGLCRAISLQKPEIDAEVRNIPSSSFFVTKTLSVLTDCIVRIGSGKRTFNGFEKNLHQEWVSQLVFQDSPACEKLKELAPALKNWRRPIALSGSAPYRFCFQLEEPSYDDELETQVSDSVIKSIAKSSREKNWSLAYYVQPLDDPTLQVSTGDILSKRSKKSSDRLKLLERNGASIQEFTLQALGQSSKLFPSIEESLRSSSPSCCSMTSQEAFNFLEEYASIFVEAGFVVRLPSWWTAKGYRKAFGLKASVNNKASSMQAESKLSLDVLLNVQWEVILDGIALSISELESLASMKNSLVRVRGRWVALSQSELQKALSFIKKAPKELSVREVMQTTLGAGGLADDLPVQDITGTPEVLEMLNSLRKPWDIAELAQPEGLAASLRPYQLRGVSWLSFLSKWRLGACLADDMGLGKTIQTLSLIQHRKNEGEKRPVLLVAPTSVLENWRREAERFLPGLKVMVHHGAGRLKGEKFTAEANENELVATSFSMLARDTELFSNTEWSGLVIDEAQNIKNHNTIQSKSARSIPADYRIALTGTPVENHVGDLWSLMEFLNPGLLGTQARFKREFFMPIQKGRDEAAAERLKQATGPFILRRLKTDKSIIDDLPEKISSKTFCRLKKEQATLYAAVVEEASRLIAVSDGIQRKGLVLSTMMRLKQVCNHPAQYLGESAPIAGRSGKLERLHELAEEALAGGDRMLIFTQYAEMGEILKRYMQETFGEETLFLHGGVLKAKRDAMVARFQEEENGPRLFVLSLKAGGTGLNLTRANHVVLFDRWWNPAVEQQAVDRAFRIGQKKNVQVHAFVCQGTVEEEIDMIIESKKEIAGVTVGSGESWLTKLSTDELKDILTLRKTALE